MTTGRDLLLGFFGLGRRGVRRCRSRGRRAAVCRSRSGRGRRRIGSRCGCRSGRRHFRSRRRRGRRGGGSGVFLLATGDERNSQQRGNEQGLFHISFLGRLSWCLAPRPRTIEALLKPTTWRRRYRPMLRERRLRLQPARSVMAGRTRMFEVLDAVDARALRAHTVRDYRARARASSFRYPTQDRVPRFVTNRVVWKDSSIRRLRRRGFQPRPSVVDARAGDDCSQTVSN